MKQITIKRVIPLNIRYRGPKADWLAETFQNVLSEVEDMVQLQTAVDGYYHTSDFLYVRDTEEYERPIFSFNLMVGNNWAVGQVEETTEVFHAPIGNEAGQLWRIMRDRRNANDADNKTEELMTEEEFLYWYGDPDCVPINGPVARTRREFNLPHSK